jgi:ABC-type iron transport system FetAB ATPase subunit
VLSIHNLSFLDYGPFSFSIHAGEGISIQGGSGAGKSLLLRAIADLDQHSGEINLYDESQDAIPAPQWRSQIGYLISETVFWADTVEEHFTDLQTPFLQRVVQTLGIEPLLQQMVAKLSSGEKQRIALLRLLANQPKALLLDEPTSHLDSKSTQAAESLIAEYQHTHQCPLVLVSHDTKQCDRMAQQHYVMQDKNLQASPE